ncbi:MAG: hypothetical protein IT380_05990 [Myxococcales bacterium]|nr:hypothetical protein [Myxococcales bacterium]
MRSLLTCTLAVLAASGCGPQDVVLTEDVQASTGAELKASEFGAKGDGVTDDGPAIAAALLALKQRGGGVLSLEPHVYRVGRPDGRWHYFSLRGAKDLTIAGNGATLRFDDQTLAFWIEDAARVRLARLTIDHSPLPYSEGRVSGTALRSFVLTVPPGDTGPFTYADLERETNGKKPPNLMFFSADGGRDRAVKATSFVPSGVEKVGPRQYLFTFDGGTSLSGLTDGDRAVVVRSFVRKLDDEVRGGETATANVIVTRSSDVEFDHVTMRASPDKAFRVYDNDGPVRFETVEIAPQPGALVSVVRDGIHAKHNKVGPTIVASTFRGILDDDVNITSMPYAVTSRTGNRWTINSKESPTWCYPVRKGDVLLAANERRGAVLPARLKVLWVDTEDCPPQGRGLTQVVELEGAAAVGDAPADLLLFDLTRSNDGFVVSGNEFRPLANRAVSVTGAGGVIARNLVQSEGGPGLWLANWPKGGGRPMAGPFARSTRVEANVIRDAFLAGIRAGVIWPDVEDPANKATVDLEFIGNEVQMRDGAGIAIENARGLTFRGNTVTMGAGAPKSALAFHLTSVAAVDCRGLTVVDLRAGIAAGVLVDGASPRSGGLRFEALDVTTAARVPPVVLPAQ